MKSELCCNITFFYLGYLIIFARRINTLCMKRSIYLFLLSIGIFISQAALSAANDINTFLLETEDLPILSPPLNDEANEIAGGQIVTQPIAGTFCLGSTIVVNFTANGNTFGTFNSFTAELSDENGSFAAPITIGSVSLTGSVNDSFIYTLVPGGLPTGTEYRIRVVSSDPNIIGSDNGAGISISSTTAPPIPTVTSNGPTAFCFGSATTFLSSSRPDGNLWFPGGVNTNPFIGVVSGGCYYTQVTAQNGCTTTSQPVCIEVNTPIFTFLGYFEDDELVTTVDTTITICEGDSAQLGVIIEGGIAPYDIFYTPDGFNFVTVNDVGVPTSPNTHTYTFYSQDPGFYQIIGIADNFPTNCGSNGNSGIVTIQTAPLPITDFSYLPFCGLQSGEPILATGFLEGGTFSFDVDPADGASVDPESGIISNAVNGNTYIIRYTVQGPSCEASSTTEITVNTSDFTDFTIDPFCSNNASLEPVGELGFATGGEFSFEIDPADGATIDPSSGIITNASGNTTYTVQYTSPAGVCQASSSFEVTTLESPNVTGVITNTLCGQAIGEIVASASAGVPDYEFLWSNDETTSTISNLVANAYSLTVTDDNGCTDDTTFTIVNDNEPELELITTDAGCNTNTGAIDLVITGGSGDFQFLWSPGNEITEDLSDLSAGSYSVEVTDLTTTCVVSASATIANENAPEATLNFENTLCGEFTGSISVELVPGTGTGEISFLWSNNETTSSITGLESGSYSVTISDEGGCELVLSQEIIDENQFQATAEITNPTCANPSSGAIAISIEGGEAPFSYSWTPNTASTTANVQNLPAGTYTVVISGSANCVQTIDNVIEPINELTLEFSQIDATCGNADGSIDLTVNGGSGAYAYNWSNGAVTEDITALESGNYSVTVVDSADNSCVANGEVTLINGNQPEIDITVTNSSCQIENGAIQLDVTGGSGSFEFSWSGPNGYTSAEEDIENLAIGNYSVTISDIVTNCEISESVTLEFDNPPVITATKVNTTCGQSNGIIDIEVVGGTAPLNIEWSNNAETLDQISLAAGSYTLTITDFNGCTDDSTFVIEPSESPLSDLEITNPSCGNDTGSVVTNLSNVQAPVTYNWTLDGAPFASFANLNDLSAGTYILNASDGNGCTVSDTATLVFSDQPTISTEVEGTICGLETGSINLTIDGGSGDVSFLWSPGNETTQNLQDLGFGCYSVVVTDANGCELAAEACVGNLNAPEIDFTVTNASCNEDNGVISASISGGVEPYSLSWIGTIATDTFLTALGSGTYTLLVIDDNGCETTDSVAVSNSGIPAINADQQNSDCGDANNGSISLTTNGGLAPYTFLWSPGNETTATISDLAPGNYSVVVTDSALCEANAQFTITTVDGPSIDFTTVDPGCGSETGVIDLILTGASGDFSYVWTGEGVNVTSEDQANLGAGDYSVIVTDNQSGCQDSVTITLNNNNAFEIDLDNSIILPTTCGVDNGSVQLVIIGGVEPFMFNWCNGDTTQNVTGLSSGVCSVTISDNSGCVVDFEFNIAPSTAPTVEAVNANASCGDCNGSIELSFPNAEEPLNILWNNGASESAIFDLCEGAYSALIIDGNGCEITYEGIIEQSGAPQIVVEPSTVDSTLCGESTASIDISVTGGSEPYIFNWNGPDVVDVNSQNISNLSAGTYTVIVSDQTLCESTLSVVVFNSDEPELEFTLTQAGCGSPTGAVDLNVIGGPGVPSFSWTGPNDFAAITQNISGLEAGTYEVTVNSGACIVTESVDIINADGPTASVSLSQDTICDGLSSLLSIALTGGAPYSFVYNDGIADISVNAFDADLFEVEVSPSFSTTYSLVSVVSDDDPSCQGSFIVEQVSILVNPSPEQPTITASGPLAFCEGGSVTLTSSSSTGNIWNELGPDQLNQSINVTQSGVYFVSVINGFGCADTSASVEVNVTPTPNLNAGPDTTICLGESIAFDLSIADEYLWSPSIYLTGTIISNPVATPLETIEYTVTGSNICGVSSDTILITVIPSINADLGEDFNACPGELVTFDLENVNGAAYSWSSSTGFVGSDSESSFTTQVISPSTVNVVVTNENGCVTADTVNIGLNEVPPAPGINAQGPTIFCEGESVVLQATTGNFVVWSNGLENFDEILVTESGSYFVTAIDGICPSNSDTIVVQVNPLPETVISYTGSSTICEGECLALSASSTGFNTIQWFRPDGNTSADLTIQACETGLYVLENLNNGCLGYDSLEVTVVPIPSEPIVTLDGPQSICEDEFTTLVSSYADGNIWLFNGEELEGETDNTLTVNQAGVYSVVYTNSVGCTATSEGVPITVKPISPLSITASPDTIVCGNQPTAVELTASSGFETYTWSPVGDGQTIIADAAGVWTVTAINIDGCDAVASITIVVAPPIELELTSPILFDNYNVSVVGGNDGSIDLTISGQGVPTGINWSGPSGFTSISEDLFNLTAGLYTVTVSDEFGCEIQDTITLIEPSDIVLPNGFTPNGDGFNDFYVIKGIQGYPDNQINIFNRWGNLVYSANGYQNNWDGIGNNGNVLPDGTYFIVVDLNVDGKELLNDYIDLRRQ